MKSRLVGALAGAVLSVAAVQVASAADLPVKAAPVAAVYNWTGFYVGGDIGVGRMNAETFTFTDPGGAAFFSCGPCGNFYDPKTLSGGAKSALLGGFHVGYNWQLAPTWLVGVVGDFTWTGLSQSANTTLSSGPGIPVVLGSNLSFQTNVKWLASLRGRAGFVQNNWLIYATGGIAFAHLGLTANAQCPPPPVAGGCVFTSGTQSPFSGDSTRTGFVLGAGAEWQMPASPWRAHLEYLYYQFNTTTSGSALFTALPGGGPLPCIVTPTCSANYTFGNVNVHTLRLGVSYAFR